MFHVPLTELESKKKKKKKWCIAWEIESNFKSSLIYLNVVVLFVILNAWHEQCIVEFESRDVDV